ncbi:MAG: serine/threonine protein kinase [Lentisphaeria bacterium]|nr:serine/threonine protein kinase [Lentisphaeria bacterium]
MEQPERIKIICRNCEAKFDVTDFEPFSTFICPECGTKLRVPRQFGPYQLDKICGRGGMSNIFRAIDPEFSRYVAVKILRAEVAADESLRRHFLAQAQLIAKIDHPGVVPIYDSGVFQEQTYLVMKYMDGGSFEHLMNHGQLPELPVLLNALASVAGGLQALLRTGIIHHDVKPGNIMFNREDGNAGLVDFDLAESPLMDGVMSGSEDWASPAYVSPEWLETGKEDFRGDIFSFGVTAYELITGQIPYLTDGDALVLLERRRHPIYLQASDLNPAISSEFSAFLDAIMAYRPADRPEYPEIIRAFQKESLRLSAKPGALKRIFNIFR